MFQNNYLRLPQHVVGQCYQAYGHHVGLLRNWEETYDQILEGNLPMINDEQTKHQTALTISKKKARGVRREKSIGDIAFNLKHGIRQ